MTMARKTKRWLGEGTHASQRPPDSLRTFQGKDVVAVQRGRCMHCRCDITSLLVGAEPGRRWVNTETFGPAQAEHTCTRAA